METMRSPATKERYPPSRRCLLILLALATPAPALVQEDTSAPIPGAPHDHPPPTFFGGIQVNEPDHDRWAAALVEAGLDSVQVTLYARQQQWDQAELSWDRDAPWVVSEIRAAKRAGLRVSLVMRVALEHGLEVNRHLWHGMIWPRRDRLDPWFDRYSDFVLWGAEIAARENVNLFVVGNELNSLASTTNLDSLPRLYSYFLDSDSVQTVRNDLVRCAASAEQTDAPSALTHLDGGRSPDLETMLRDEERIRRAWTLQALGGDAGNLTHLNARRGRYEAFWRTLVGRVRERYSGLVSYGANFDQFEEVGFWDALDFIAVNAYFPLSIYGLDPAARVGHMVRSWQRVAADLQRAGGSLPVVLLELGWTRRLGSTVRPFSYDRVEVLETVELDNRRTCVHWESQPDDPGERVAALQALADVVQSGGFPALRGFTLWKLTTRAEHRTIEPFAAVLQPGAGYSHEAWRALELDRYDELDRAYIGLASTIAREVQGRLERWHNGTVNSGNHQE